MLGASAGLLSFGTRAYHVLEFKEKLCLSDFAKDSYRRETGSGRFAQELRGMHRYLHASLEKPCTNYLRLGSSTMSFCSSFSCTIHHPCQLCIKDQALYRYSYVAVHHPGTVYNRPSFMQL